MSKNLDTEFENYFLVKAKDPAMLAKVKKAAEARGLSYLDAYCAIAPKFKDRSKLERKLREMSEKEAVTLEGKVPATYKQSGPAVPQEIARAGALDDSKEAYHVIGEEKTIPPKPREELLDNLVELESAEPPKSKEQIQQSRTKTMPNPKKPAPAIKQKPAEEPQELDLAADLEKQFADEDEPAPKKLADPLGSGLRASKPADAIECEIPKYQSEEKYNLVKQLGKGGMGVVLEVTDNAIGRNVALKKIKGITHPQKTARFDEEAKITGRLEHPNIIPVHEFVTDEATNEHYFTMKLVKGEDLEKILEKKSAKEEDYHRKYDRASLLRIFIDVCNALAYAHDHNVIHRDIKPANIMIGKFGEVLVMDWGLGKVIGTPEELDVTGQSVIPMKSAGLTADGVVMGTPAYMAPEQAEGKLSEMDAKTDIFSLGAMLYEIITGKKPTSAKTMDDLLQKRVDGVIDKMPMFTPKELESIILKAMALEKDERYDSAEELAEDVQRYLDGELVKAHHYSAFDKIGRVVKRNAGKIVLSGAGALMLTGAIAAISYFQGQASKAEAEKIKANEKTVLAEKDKAKAEAIAEKEKGKTLEAKAEAADLRANAKQKELDAIEEARKKNAAAERFVQQAYLSFNLKEYSTAITQLTEAIKIDPKHATARHDRALSYRYLAQTMSNADEKEALIRNALEDLVVAVKLDETNTWYRMEYARVLELTGQIEQAEREYGIAIEQRGSHPYARSNRAAFYSRRALNESGEKEQSLLRKAVSDYLEYLKVVPADGIAHASLANQYNRLKEYNSAAEYARKAVIEKKYLGAHYEWGEAEYKLGHPEEAEEHFKKAREHRPDRKDGIEYFLKEIEKLKKK